MPRGDKDKYTDKQKRKAEHIEDSYEAKGVSKNEAESRAWATVNKQSGGGERKEARGRKPAKRQRQRLVNRQAVERQLADKAWLELVSNSRT